MIKIYDLEKIPKDKLELLINRSTLDIKEVEEKVRAIIKYVRDYGNEEVYRYTEVFDGCKLDSLKINNQEIKDAWENIDTKLLKQIKKQIEFSKEFHKRQKLRDKKFEISKGIILGERYSPIESVGLYVPGGRAAYPTVLQILAVPAIIAKVPRIVVCTPPNKKGKIADSVLVCADLLGIREIYKVGGAQAIAALAYGTETIRPVKKVVGPGNIFVSCAKMLLFGKIDIDMPAGPSEALIIADTSADASFVAADILARCEHDPNASAVLLTDSEKLANNVKKEIQKQFLKLKRKDIIKKSLGKYSAIIISKDWKKIIDFANEYAAEHVELIVNKPWKILDEIKNAGSVFLGRYAPVAVGDYASGTNHVLPTGQFSKMFSPVGVDTFVKKTEFQYLTKNGLKALDPIIRELSKEEGLDGHYNSVKVRLENESRN